MQIIIYVRGKPNFNGHRRREFIWDASRSVYVYQSKILDEIQFAQICEPVLKKYNDMCPFVKILDSEPKVIKVEAEPPPVFTALPVQEPTLEEALEIVKKLAPDKLKPRPGRKVGFKPKRHRPDVVLPDADAVTT
jgi:hypothetical protein